MLDNFRTNMRGVATVIVVIIGAVFVFSGTGSLFLSGPGAEVAAVINDEQVSDLRVQQVMSTEKQRILEQNQGLDPAVLDDELLRPAVLQQIITGKVLSQSAKKQGFGISSKQISELLIDAKGFQVDGRFDQKTFEYVIRQQGYTSATFIEMIKQDLIIQQFTRAISGTNFVTETEVASLAKYTEQTRDYYYLTLPMQPIADSVRLSDQQISDYYDENQGQYQTEVQVSVEAIELNPSVMAVGQSITDAQIQERFDQEASSVDAAEQLQAAHILLTDANDENLMDIQAKLDAGEDFAKLAQTYSDDPVSAEVGGDLGYTTGDTFPEAFEEALASLEVDQVSAPVVTDAGTHFIKLLDRQVQRFELSSERGRIERELINEAATDALVEKLEMLKELSFNAETLADVAVDLGLDVQETAPFSRDGGVGVAAYPAVISAAFSKEVLEEKYASEVMDLGDDRYVVIKLKEHFPARQKALSEVKDAVSATLKESIAKQQITEQGSALLARVEAGESIETVAKAQDLDWQVASGVKRISNSVNAEIRNAAFAMASPNEGAELKGIFTANGDYVVLSLNEVTTGNLDDLSRQERLDLVTAVQTVNGSRDLQAYQASLLANADIVQ
ncbi:MAG: SurA N-terminal domain-containing protein [Porticoccaceae bacterium]|nr:SurA N-terminal domain-containing protein [Porticoccaceae bacterium]